MSQFHSEPQAKNLAFLQLAICNASLPLSMISTARFADYISRKLRGGFYYIKEGCCVLHSSYFFGETFAFFPVCRSVTRLPEARGIPQRHTFVAEWRKPRGFVAPGRTRFFPN